MLWINIAEMTLTQMLLLFGVGPVVIVFLLITLPIILRQRKMDKYHKSQIKAMDAEMWYQVECIARKREQAQQEQEEMQDG